QYSLKTFKSFLPDLCRTLENQTCEPRADTQQAAADCGEPLLPLPRPGRVGAPRRVVRRRPGRGRADRGRERQREDDADPLPERPAPPRLKGGRDTRHHRGGGWGIGDWGFGGCTEGGAETAERPFGFSPSAPAALCGKPSRPPTPNPQSAIRNRHGA